MKQKKKCPIDIKVLSKYISYARKNCHPRLSFEAAEILKRHYINFREIAKQREKQTGNQTTIPITVRQLEAIIRLSESLAKLQFQEQANEGHVKEAVQLFRFSTMKAVEQVHLIDEGMFQDKSKLQKEIQKIEDSFRVRYSIGIRVDVVKVIKSLTERGYKEYLIIQALHSMFLRNEIEYFSGRKILKRKK